MQCDKSDADSCEAHDPQLLRQLDDAEPEHGQDGARQEYFDPEQYE